MQTRSFGESRNKVSVGEPAEGSLPDGLLFRNSERKALFVGAFRRNLNTV